MAISVKTIKQRLRSIRNTQKITRAMEMVSAAKMRRTVTMVTLAREYAHTAWGLLRAIRHNAPIGQILMEAGKDADRLAMIVFTGNRGLCGSFNSQVIGSAYDYIAINGYNADQVDWIVIGKYGMDLLKRRGVNVIGQYIKEDLAPTAASVSPVVTTVLTGFRQGQYRQAVVAYTDFVSAIIQRPRVHELLPLASAPDAGLGHTNHEQTLVTTDSTEEYLFEPEQSQVFTALTARIIDIQLYQALLESNASEHAARMFAMRNASDAALDMIDDLTLTFNQARQANITREIAEITGGKAALEQSRI